MKLSKNCIPIGALPYSDMALATRMIMRLFENFPYLPFFPNIEKKDNIIHRTLEKLPGIIIKDKSIILNNETNKFSSDINKMDDAYNNPTLAALEKYKFTSPFLVKYFQIIERVKPSQTVINLLGPFTISQIVEVNGITSMIADKLYRKYLIQALTLKVLWFVHKIYQISPQTKPIILFEEPKLNEFGVLKKENENITREIVLNLYSKLFQNIHATEALVGVQSFQKCDWQIPIEAGVDIISFDAYNNQSSLTIMSDAINKFLANGGMINWGIVPVMTESMVKSLNIHFLQDRFMNATRELIESGVKRNLLYKNATVSLQGDVSMLPLIFAEKALILSTQLGEKISKVS